MNQVFFCILSFRFRFWFVCLFFSYCPFFNFLYFCFFGFGVFVFVVPAFFFFEKNNKGNLLIFQWQTFHVQDEEIRATTCQPIHIHVPNEPTPRTNLLQSYTWAKHQQENPFLDYFGIFVKSAIEKHFF